MLWFAQGSTSCRNHFPPPAPLEISGHNSRVAALPKRWDPLRTGLDLVLDERAPTCGRARRIERAAGARLQGKESRPAGKPASTSGWFRCSARCDRHERRAAEELGPWKTVAEERKALDVPPAAITLGP